MAGKSFSALKHGKLNMKQYFKIILMVLIGWLGITASDSDAGIFDKVVRKEAMRRILQRDVARDAATRAIPSATEKKVWRYTSKARAKQEASRGIAAGKHMTSGVYSGRSPSPQTAQKRYGLPKPPEVRETVVIKKVPQSDVIKPSEVILEWEKSHLKENYQLIALKVSRHCMG